MLDPKFLEDHASEYERMLKARGMQDLIQDVQKFVKFRADWKNLKSKLDSLRHERNVISEAINQAMKQGNKAETEKKKQAARKIVSSLEDIEKKISSFEQDLEALILKFPNTIAKLPEKDKIVLVHGKPKKEKWHKTYEEIGIRLGLIDIHSATKMSGAGFYILTSLGAKLERALANFFLDLNVKRGYVENSLPVLVTEQSMVNSGHLPKFREDMFHTQDNLFLIPTSEVSLLNLHSGKIFAEKDLPLCVTAYSNCFRMERGATRGFIRVRQFNKVEMFKFTKAEQSEKEHEKMLKDAIETCKLLGIPFRVKLLCASEMGFVAHKTYDLETFALGTGEWLEISSVSNCLEFQARRSKIKYLENGEKKFVHTLNGSGLALPRTLISLLENNQQKDGSVKIPKVLQKYFGVNEIKGKKENKKEDKKRKRRK